MENLADLTYEAMRICLSISVVILLMFSTWKNGHSTRQRVSQPIETFIFELKQSNAC
jgi:hypothetical protein